MLKLLRFLGTLNHTRIPSASLRATVILNELEEKGSAVFETDDSTILNEMARIVSFNPGYRLVCIQPDQFSEVFYTNIENVLIPGEISRYVIIRETDPYVVRQL